VGQNLGNRRGLDRDNPRAGSATSAAGRSVRQANAIHESIVMSKPKQKAGNGFVMWSSTQDRASVVQAITQLAGPSAASQDFLLRFSRESDLATFMSRRVDATVAKFMFAVAECFVREIPAPLLTVGGAKLQHGSGNSLYQQGQLFGTQAAHLGIGTVTLHNEAVSQAGLSRVRDLAIARGIPLNEIYSELPANGRLVTFGLANDAATFLAPAFTNQSEGKLEVVRQELMRGLLGIPIPHTPEQLESLLILTGERVVDFLVNKRKVAVDPIDNRLAAIASGANKEFRQHPADVDNLLFGGREQAFLEALRSQAADQNSEFRSLVSLVERHVAPRAQMLVSVAVESKSEGGGP
jgi:hypothetical protein